MSGLFAHQPPWKLRLAAWLFRARRADYYAFLAHMLERPGSDQTLLMIFQQDSQRHGLNTVRGQLASWWSTQYALTGGDLIQTWRSTIPQTDLHSLALAQEAGQFALAQTFRSLAVQVRQWQTCWREFVTTVALGWVALVIAMACVFVLPQWAVPRLLAAFAMVPSEHYGASTRSLINWSQHVQGFWYLWGLGLGGISAALIWSVYGLTGALRDYLDRFGVWRLYRDLQAMRLLAGAATLLTALSPTGVGLRTVLVALQRQANPWLDCHLQRMIRRLDAGEDALSSLDTGLLSGDVWWQFIDTVRIHGLAQGLGQAAQQVGQVVQAQLATRALWLRWMLLIAALLTVMAVGWWHLRVIDELRQSLTLHYAIP
jgi:hypothetical protein